jgi:sugar lactone lactonase YvrE
MIQKLPAPELLFRSEAHTGEGPVWSNGNIIWVDIYAGKIHTTNAMTGKTSTITLDAVVGAVVEIENSDEFIMAMQEGFAIVKGSSIKVIDKVLDSKTHLMNDGKCDALGRFWAGSYEKNCTKGMGALHLLTGPGPSVIVADGFASPNGIGWTLDNKTMFFVDSLAHQVYRTEFDLMEARIGKFELFAKVNFGLPDGIAVDVDGCIWVAVWGGSKVVRISPQGEIIAEIATPVSQPSSCAFGPDGTLYITSATSGLSESDLSNQPLAGSLFAVPTNTQGVPVSKFWL